MVVNLNMGVSPSMEVSLRVGNSTTELQMALGGLTNTNTDLDYQVRLSHHLASFQAFLCSLYPTIINLATLVQFLESVNDLINHYIA